MNETHVLYLDNLQRLLLAEMIESNGDTLVVKNPIILNVQTDNNGKINIQFFPVMFREFQADKDEGTVWEINKKNITLARNVTLDARLIAQYKNIFAPMKSIAPAMGSGIAQGPAPVSKDNIIKLFDE